MTPPPGLDHVVLTRFNLPSAGPESLIRAQDGWLRGRVELFEKYCLPSVAAQSEQGFWWVIYFDPESPTWLRDRISGWCATTARLVPRYREEVPKEALLTDLSDVTGRTRTRLLTTNLDNDDGLADDFVARLQSAVADVEEQTAVYYPTGLISGPDGVYARVDRRNAFCSVVEPWDGAVTCWSEWHNLLGDRMPVLEVTGPAAWLQVVHQTNVSNRVRGRLTSPEPFRARFGAGLEEAVSPSTRKLVADRALLGPARSARDGARGIVKDIAFRIVGKDGLDRAKLGLTRARSRLRAVLGGGRP